MEQSSCCTDPFVSVQHKDFNLLLFKTIWRGSTTHFGQGSIKKTSDPVVMLGEWPE